MRASINLLSVLATLAIGSPIITKRETLVSSYTITGFRTFTADPGSTPGNSTVSFEISDNLDNHATCTYITAPSASDAASSTHFHACDDANFSFLWDGTALRVIEFYNVSGASNFTAVTTLTTPSLTCYTESNIAEPFGPGKVCETATGQVGGTKSGNFAGTFEKFGALKTQV